jgi:uncharacterized protein YkwD
MHPRRKPLAAALAVAALLAAPTGARADRAANELLSRINGFRAAHGRAPLDRSRALERSAGRYARILLARGSLSHMGIRPGRRFRRVGENLAWHAGRRARIRTVLRGWKTSPGHRALLLSRGFRWAGLRRARGGATVWVLHLGGR